jgi:AcrR family transcriptional regulator
VSPVPDASATAARSGRRGERTADRILDAAEAVFAERGFAGTSLRDVAERVGVRAPSLYNHFDSKEALYAAVLERAVGPLLALLADAAAGRGPRDSGQLVADVMALLGRHPHLPRLVTLETLAGGQRLTPMLRRWIAPAFARARELVEADPGARRFEGEQIPHLVLAMYHVVVGYFTATDLYAELAGEDALSDAALGRQTRFLRELVALLFPNDAPTTPEESP